MTGEPTEKDFRRALSNVMRLPTRAEKALAIQTLMIGAMFLLNNRYDELAPPDSATLTEIRNFTEGFPEYVQGAVFEGLHLPFLNAVNPRAITTLNMGADLRETRDGRQHGVVPRVGVR